MCTAITYQTKDHYFGRNLDLDYSYKETVTVTPRNFPFHFRNGTQLLSHHAFIGMANIVDGYPLYYDATNEHGLSMAGLNFPQMAVYQKTKNAEIALSPFELIPWILGSYTSVAEVLEALKNICIVNIPFSKEFPNAPLHWIIADNTRAITVEPFADGLKIYENPVGILTNNPSFEYHMTNLNNYLNLTSEEPENRFCSSVPLSTYCRGMGAMGMPGDLSSASRFVRAAFTKLNSVSGESESDSLSQFFHILGSVAQQQGCIRTGSSLEKTIYSSCCNADKGIYYYTTYENSQITGVDMHKHDLNCSALAAYPIIRTQQIKMVNG